MVHPMDKKPLNIPPSKGFKGLTVYCYRCKTNVSEVCKETGKALNRCPYGDKHTFKIYIHVPGTQNTRKTKTLETRNLDEATRQAMEFEREVKSGQVRVEPKFERNYKREVQRTEEIKPELLVHVLARYIAFLRNEDVPAHRAKERSEEYVKDLERSFMRLKDCLRKNGHDLNSFLLKDINDKVIGELYKYLDNRKQSPRSFNKSLTHFSSVMKWYCEEYDVPVKNWFARINRRTTIYNPQSISKEDFDELLKKITPENGIQKYDKGAKRERNFYRSWLADGFQLGLFSGRRREEIVTLKWSDVVEDKEGKPLYIKSADIKVNRIQHRSEEEKKYIYIPLTQELKNLLRTLGYDSNRGSGKYLLAPEKENGSSRDLIMDDLSRGFSHFFRKLGKKEELKFGCLRKTYISHLRAFLGNNAKYITGHTNDAIIDRHYQDPAIMVSTADNFGVYTARNTREDEIEKIRTKQAVEPTKTIER